MMSPEAQLAFNQCMTIMAAELSDKGRDKSPDYRSGLLDGATIAADVLGKVVVDILEARKTKQN